MSSCSPLKPGKLSLKKILTLLGYEAIHNNKCGACSAHNIYKDNKLILYNVSANAVWVWLRQQGEIE